MQRSLWATAARRLAPLTADRRPSSFIRAESTSAHGKQDRVHHVEHCDVVIVGAGLAGLSCAYHLRKLAPQLKVIVLEASDDPDKFLMIWQRIGGRTLTEKMGNANIDLGGAWIHGGQNEIYPLAAEAGICLEQDELDPDIARESPTVFCKASLSDDAKYVAWDARDGKQIPDWALKRLIGEQTDSPATDQVGLDEKLRAEIWSESERLRLSSSPDQSLENTISQILKKPEWKQQISELNSALGDQKGNLLMNAAIKFYEGYNATPLHELSSKWISDGGGEEGGDKLVLNGMSTLAKYLAQSVDVRLGHAVNKVIYQGPKEHKVVVDTANDCSFEASHAVVTVSLGVLKSEAIGFQPPLPQRKSSCISRMGYNVLDKVVLRFSERFWPKNLDWMVSLTDTPSDTLWIMSLYKHTKEPILVVFVSPTQSRRNESFVGGDEQIVDTYVSCLEKFFGPCARTLLIESKCTHWARDPLFYGSYSGYVLGSTAEDWDIMAEPIFDDTVLFAGEATRRTHPGTVDAAALSGKREADRIATIRARLSSRL